MHLVKLGNFRSRQNYSSHASGALYLTQTSVEDYGYVDQRSEKVPHPSRFNHFEQVPSNLESEVFFLGEIRRLVPRTIIKGAEKLIFPFNRALI
jgi:hypothetical protein